jgi:hypothetical protein
MKISHYGQEATASRADANEVRSLFMRAMEGWNVGSGEAFAAPFAEDADFVEARNSSASTIRRSRRV